MTVSVIIPVYRRQHQCEKAIESVLAQNVADTEIIVVDDGSPTPFVVTNNDSRIRLIRHDNNRGAAAARNTGIAAASGEWIAFLDSDDEWLPDKLQSQLQFALDDEIGREDSSTTCYATGFIMVNSVASKERMLLPIESSDPVDFASGCWFAPGSTALMRKATAERIGPIDASLARLEDYDWFLRLSLIGGMLKVAPILGSRIHTGRKPDPMTVERALSALHNKWLARRDRATISRDAQRNMKAYFDLERASAAKAAGHWLRFAVCLGRSLTRVPRLQVYLRRWWRRPPPLRPIEIDP